MILLLIYLFTVNVLAFLRMLSEKLHCWAWLSPAVLSAVFWVCIYVTIKHGFLNSAAVCL